MPTTAFTAPLDHSPVTKAMAAALHEVTLATAIYALLLDNVSVEIRRGQVTALLDEAECSATTVLDLFDGRVRPSHGSVQVAGHEVTQLDPGELSRLTRDHIARVQPAYGVPQQLSVQQNLVVAQQQARQPVDLAWVDRVARVMGLDGRPRHGRPAGAHANRARWAIASRLATKPTLLLLTDTTEGMTRVEELDLMEALLEAAHQFETGILLATSDPIAASSADRTLLLRRGSVTDITGEL
jgi:putative ABC transport system ATP-binding protein